MGSFASQGNIKLSEIYMICIMLNKLNEFGKKAPGVMAFYIHQTAYLRDYLLVYYDKTNPLS